MPLKDIKSYIQTISKAYSSAQEFVFSVNRTRDCVYELKKCEYSFNDRLNATKYPPPQYDVFDISRMEMKGLINEHYLSLICSDVVEFDRNTKFLLYHKSTPSVIYSIKKLTQQEIDIENAKREERHRLEREREMMINEDYNTNRIRKIAYELSKNGRQEGSCELYATNDREGFRVNYYRYKFKTKEGYDVSVECSDFNKDEFIELLDKEEAKIVARNKLPNRCIRLFTIECSICRDGDTKDLCVTPCGHAFHISCLKYWMRVNHLCPNCKTEIN